MFVSLFVLVKRRGRDAKNEPKLKKTAGAFFTTYEGVKYTLGSIPNLPTPINHATASSCAEMVSCLMITPAEVLKQNVQVIHNQKQGRGQSRSSRSVFLTVASRFRHAPWKLWSGYTALVGRNLPFTGLHFPLFEYVRSHLVAWREADIHPGKQGQGQGQDHGHGSISGAMRAVLTGVSAAFSGTVASVVTTPTDVIKTRMMLAASDDNKPGSGSGSDSRSGPGRGSSIGKKKTGTVEVGKQIYQKEGIRGLFRGGLLKAGWTALSLGLYLGIYEGGRLYLGNRRETTHEGNKL